MHPQRLMLTIVMINLFFFILNFKYTQADIYRYKDETGVWHFTNIRSDRRYRLFIKTDRLEVTQYIINYDKIINRAATEFDVDPHLIKAVIMAESSFDPEAVSEKGAQGLMQLMPTTSEDMNVENPFNPEENIFGGTKYLSLLLKKFNHDKKMALAAYNIGPTVVSNHNSVPPVPQTERFVEKVIEYYMEFKERFD